MLWGRDDAPPPVATHDERFFGERGIVALFHRGVKGVAIDMGEREIRSIDSRQHAGRTAVGTSPCTRAGLRKRGEAVATQRPRRGGARGALWRQIQADVYGMPVGLPEAEEGPAFGAALLAGVGVGNWTSVENAADASVRVSQQIEPLAQNLALMNRQYREYRKLYPALREIGRDIH